MLDLTSSSGLEAGANLNIIFIDPQIDNYSHLISGVEQAEVIVLDGAEDGIAQITAALSQYQNIASVQIISHGSGGHLKIGTTDLNIHTIEKYTEELQQWSQYLDEDADILLMGCKVGTDLEFIESFAELTDADLAASKNLTGYRGSNGDWQLETNVGEIESELNIDSETLYDYQSILELESELIVELDFNDRTGNIAIDSATDGNNNDGILARGAAFAWEDEFFDGVVELHGDDFVAIASAPEINEANRASRTVSVWFNANNINSDVPQVIYQEGGLGRGLNIYLDRGELYVGGWNHEQSKWTGTFLASDNISSNNWHHVALVLDAQPEVTTIQTDVLFAYLDGEEIGRGSGSQVFGSRGIATFGGLSGSSKLHHKNVIATTPLGLIGTIDEARIYNRALSATEIASLADLESRLNPNRLVAQLKLDEVEGSLAEDSRENTSGILHNGAYFEPVGEDLGNGVRFDGHDDVITLRSSYEINFGVHNRRTVSVWFNADDVNSDTPQVIYEEGGGGRGLNIYLDGGRLYVGGWNRIESDWSGTFLNTNLVSSHTWHHVALVLNAPQTDVVQPDVLFAYLDGQEIGRGAGSQLWGHGAIGLGGVNIYTRFHRNDIGANNVNGFAGNIASLEIYNRALDSKAIDNLASLQTPDTPVNSLQKFTAEHEYFNYDGRVDWQNPQAPALGYPGTSIELKFTGTQLQIELSEDNFGRENYVDVYLDDRPEPIKIHLRKENGRSVVYDVVEGLEDKVHNAVIYKRTDYSTGEFKFHSVTIDGELLPANPDSQRTIEVYGNSITSGIAVEYPISGVRDPDIQDKTGLANAYYSYGSILARAYEAEVSLVSQAGISLVDGYSRNRFWQDMGGETIYDKVKPLENADLWNFNNYSPDLVIIAYGQNDAASVGDSMTKEEWKERYKQMIANLRDKHADSYFVGMFPAMNHNRQWDSYIIEAIAEYRIEYNDHRVFSLIHEQVTPGHPRISEQETMADTLKELIDGTLTDNGFHWGISRSNQI